MYSLVSVSIYYLYGRHRSQSAKEDIAHPYPAITRRDFFYSYSQHWVQKHWVHMLRAVPTIALTDGGLHLRIHETKYAVPNEVKNWYVNLAQLRY
jgi:hypothetical protein